MPNFRSRYRQVDAIRADPVITFAEDFFHKLSTLFFLQKDKTTSHCALPSFLHLKLFL